MSFTDQQLADYWAANPGAMMQAIYNNPLAWGYSQDEADAIGLFNFYGVDTPLPQPGFLADTQQQALDTMGLDAPLDLPQLDPLGQNIDNVYGLIDQYQNAETLDDFRTIAKTAPTYTPLVDFGGPAKQAGPGVAVQEADNRNMPLVNVVGNNSYEVTDIGYSNSPEYLKALTDSGQLPELPPGFDWNTKKKSDGSFVITADADGSLGAQLFPSLVRAGISYGFGGPLMEGVGLSGMLGGFTGGVTASTVDQLIATGEIDPTVLLKSGTASGLLSGVTANLKTSGEVLTGIDEVDAWLKEADIIGTDPTTGELGWLSNALEDSKNFVDELVFGDYNYDTGEETMGLLRNPVADVVFDIADAVGLDDALAWVVEQTRGDNRITTSPTYDPDTGLSTQTLPSAKIVLADPSKDIAEIQAENPDVIVVPGLPEAETKDKEGSGGDGSGGGGTTTTSGDGEYEEEVDIVTEDPFGDTTSGDGDKPEPDVATDSDNESEPDVVVDSAEEPEPDVLVLGPGDTPWTEPDTSLNPNEDPEPDVIYGGGTLDSGGGGDGVFSMLGDDEYDLFDYFRLNEPKAAQLRKRVKHFADLVAKMEING